MGGSKRKIVINCISTKPLKCCFKEQCTEKTWIPLRGVKFNRNLKVERSTCDI